nr:hypothetical protein [Tanacetum cinerariifolium]
MNPGTTQTQLLRDSNKLYLADIHPELKGWELFFREHFFCSLGKRNKVNACTAYMLYYLTIKRKFNFTLMVIYRMKEVKNKQYGPMPFAMLLTRIYNHILQTNPQAIVPLARFTFHEHVMEPLDISRNLSKGKGKKIVSSSEVKNKQYGPMPFAMLLTRIYNHILQTNPQAIVPLARFTFHEHVMEPLDISRNLSKGKGKKIVSSSVISSSSSSSNDNEAPSFLEFYDELSDSEDLTKVQHEKRGMFKCLNRYVGTITKYLEKQK